MGPGASPSRASRAAVSAVDRRRLRAVGQQRLAEARATQHRLKRPNVGVLAVVRGGHHRQFRTRQLERVGRTRVQSASSANGLTADRSEVT